MDEGRRFPTAAPATDTGRQRTTARGGQQWPPSAAEERAIASYCLHEWAARRGGALVIGLAASVRARSWADVRRRAAALAGVALVVELDRAERRGDEARVAELEQLARQRARRAA